MKQSILLLIASVLFVFPAVGQNEDGLNKEVKVIKPYKPTVNETPKINDMPKFQPHSTERPAFDYSIHQQADVGPQAADTIQAVKVEKQAIEQGIGLIRLGIGNYHVPYGELFLNYPVVSTTFGLHLNYINSIGKIKLQNGDRVKAPSSEAGAELYVNHYFRNMTAHAKVYFDRQDFRYYGYTGDKLSDIEKERMPWWNYQQAFSTVGVELNLGSSDFQNDLRYQGSLNVQRFETETGQVENSFKVVGQVEQKFDFLRGRLDVAISHVAADSIYHTTNMIYGQRKQTVLEGNPSVLFLTKALSVRAGLNGILVVDPNEYTNILLTPTGEVNWAPLSWLSLFSEFNGYMKHNHYSAIAAENRYVNPYHDFKNTKYKYNLSGGVRGSYQFFGFNMTAAYSSIKDQYFYILQNYNNVKNNAFDVVYDDMKQLSLGAELVFNPANTWSILLKGVHYGYDTDNEAYAWNMPDFEASMSFRYSPSGQALRFTADINCIGDRKGLEITKVQGSSDLEKIWTMPAIVDLSLGAEYQLTKQISFWGKINNMTTQQYDRWLGYTNKRLNILAGFSFSF